jgi:sulfide:quinone oxidoreductase
MGKTILILGGGMGGIVAANELRRKLSNEHKIILIDKSDSHFFYPSLLWILEGKRTPEQIVRKFDRLKRKGIEFHQAEITKIDPVEKKVDAGGTSYSYDYLIIALGAELDCGAIPGITEEQCLYELQGILKTKEKLNNFSGGKVYVVVSRKPYKCPAAPYEAALSLHAILKKKGIRDKVDLRLFTVEEGPMGVAGPKISAAVRGMVETQGIKYHPTYKLVSSDSQNKEIVFDNGEKYNFDLLLIVPPHKAPDVVKEAGLLGESGWVPVNMQTLETKHPGVFAVGDINGIKLSNGKALPKAGVFAHFEAEVVVKRIADEINGKIPTKEFSGGGSCFLEVGGGRGGLAFGNFYAKPDPKVTMLPPSKPGHWAKVLFEKWWLRRWF